MPEVALAFPTGSDPRSPYLALPYLAAALRKSGISVVLHDLDIGGVHALLEPEHLRKCALLLQNRWKGAKSSEACTRRLIGISERLPEMIVRHMSVFNDPTRFFDPHELSAAREALLDGLDVCSAALDRRVHYSISPVKYDVDGVDCASLASIIDATQDDRFNLFAEYWENELFPRLAKQRPLLLGITLTNRQQLLPGLTLARRARSRGHRVVLGGALLSKFATRLATLPEFFDLFADAVITYEGDTAIVHLADVIENDRDWSDVPNLMYVRCGRVLVNRTHVEDVDALPAPDFEGLPLERYLTPTLVLPVLMGKGCYFNRCKFCDIPFINHISSKAYRLRASNRIASDLSQLYERFQCRLFEFTDEALAPRALEQLAETLAPLASHRFRFVGYARLEPGFTPQLCSTIAKMGVRKLYFGLESASQQTLTHMDKGIRIGEVPFVLKHCRDVGILFHIFSIIGFPEETEDRARETLRFFELNSELLDSPGNTFDVHQFGLELRTSYAEHADKVGVVIGNAVRTAEFAIGAGRDWANTRGLQHQEVDALLSEAAELLLRLFRRWHASPQPLWPGNEEFALAYADHYEGRHFPFRTTLPSDEETHLYSLAWRPGCFSELRGEGIRFILSRYGEIGMEEDSYARLALMNQISVHELLQQLSTGSSGEEQRTAREALREVFDEWIVRGLVQLNPALEGMAL